MRERVENLEVGSFAESPLKPIRNRLCLLKALGLPIRVEDEEATVVNNKSIWRFFAILLLIFAASHAPWAISFNLLYHLNSNETWTIQEHTLYQKNGMSRWTLNGKLMFYSFFTLMQFIFLPFYHRLGPKFEKFIKDYQSISMKLGYGEF